MKLISISFSMLLFTGIMMSRCGNEASEKNEGVESKYDEAAENRTTIEENFVGENADMAIYKSENIEYNTKYLDFLNSNDLKQKNQSNYYISSSILLCGLMINFNFAKINNETNNFDRAKSE